MKEKTPEFSRTFEVAEMEPAGTAVSEQATAEECLRVAERLGLPKVQSLAIEGTIWPEGEGGARGRLRLAADVTQTSVVSLEPMAAHVETEIDTVFLPEAALAVPSGKKEIEIPYEEDEADVAEPVTNGVIDLGELAVQHLLLALDPYPRKEGEWLEVEEDSGESAEENPFAVLKKLKESP